MVYLLILFVYICSLFSFYEPSHVHAQLYSLTICGQFKFICDIMTLLVNHLISHFLYSCVVLFSTGSCYIFCIVLFIALCLLLAMPFVYVFYVLCILLG